MVEEIDDICNEFGGCLEDMAREVARLRKGPKIRLLHAGSGDWVGLYIDGKLIMEGHDISAREVIDIFYPNCDYKSIYHEDEYLESYDGSCPVNWPEELG
jgi:hypothetical protein